MSEGRRVTDPTQEYAKKWYEEKRARCEAELTVDCLRQRIADDDRTIQIHLETIRQQRELLERVRKELFNTGHTGGNVSSETCRLCQFVRAIGSPDAA